MPPLMLNIAILTIKYANKGSDAAMFALQQQYEAMKQYICKQ